MLMGGGCSLCFRRVNEEMQTIVVIAQGDTRIWISAISVIFDYSFSAGLFEIQRVAQSVLFCFNQNVLTVAL